MRYPNGGEIKFWMSRSPHTWKLDRRVYKVTHLPCTNKNLQQNQWMICWFSAPLAFYHHFNFSRDPFWRQFRPPARFFCLALFGTAVGHHTFLLNIIRSVHVVTNSKTNIWPLCSDGIRPTAALKDLTPVTLATCFVCPVGGGPRCEIRLSLTDAQLYFYTLLTSSVVETKVLCLIDRKVAFICPQFEHLIDHFSFAPCPTFWFHMLDNVADMWSWTTVCWFFMLRENITTLNILSPAEWSQPIGQYRLLVSFVGNSTVEVWWFRITVSILSVTRHYIR